ncbi:MAG: hypothetical protein LQ338_000223 [Usnochroma carphineum]|nr:MAG: hypothetical protein LQ338_000223 [Usnochroma carphineum]
MSEHSFLLRPTPRRNFDFTPSSTNPPTPAPEPQNALDSEQDNNGNGLKCSDRNRSILNLTSSTLFGIYAPSDSPKDGSLTPWATGFETPGPSPKSIDDQKPPVIGAYDKPQMHRRPSQPHITVRKYYLPLILRTILLFFFGVAYGSIVTHLHDNQRIVPVKVEGIDRYTWQYLAFWGIAGVLLGRLLPWIDVFWERTLGREEHFTEHSSDSEDTGPQEESQDEEERPSRAIEGVLGADWTPVVRSIGAFVGIAFAIVCAFFALRIISSAIAWVVSHTNRQQRKLPWQSTLQVSLTLAMVNPALWYLIDRSKTGFLLSATVGVAGTAVLLGVNPSMVPAPPTPSPRTHASSATDSFFYGYEISSERLISNESIAVSTWIASVLFCSSVCFGNIGRRLALSGNGRKASLV